MARTKLKQVAFAWPKHGYSTGKNVFRKALNQHLGGTLADLAAERSEPQVIPYTRDQFAALPEDEQKKLKHGLRYFVGGLCDGNRADDNISSRGYVTLDIESKNPDKQPKSPEHLIEVCRLLDIGVWVYTTLNHTADAPRYRVVMPLLAPIARDGSMRANLKRETLDAAKYLGLAIEFVDPKSWAPSQPMFLPAALKDVKPINELVEGRCRPKAEHTSAEKAVPEKSGKQHADAVVDGLIKTGLYLHEDTKQKGKHYFRCPRWEEHGEYSEGNTSQTVYYEHGSFDPTAHALDRNQNAPASVVCMDTHLDDADAKHMTLPILKKWLRERLGQEYTGYQFLADFPDLRPGTRKQRERLTPQTVAEFLDHDPPVWLVPGLVPRGEGVLVQGASGAGKSFFALDLACRLATGMDWNGRPVPQGLWCVYIAAEGAASIRKRLQAWLAHQGNDLGELRLLVIPDTLDLAKEADCVRVAEQVLDATAGVGVGAFFVDTLARATAGLNENSSEMGTPLRHLQGLSRALGGTPVTVHHLGKDHERGGRGWSGIHADMDTVLEIATTGDTRTLRVVKQRDGDEGQRYGYTLEQVGDSAVVLYCDAPAPAERPLSGEAARLHSVLESLNSRGQSIRLKDAQAAFHAAKVAHVQEGKKPPRLATTNQQLGRLLANPVAGYVLDPALEIIRCPSE